MNHKLYLLYINISSFDYYFFKSHVAQLDRGIKQLSCNFFLLTLSHLFVCLWICMNGPSGNQWSTKDALQSSESLWICWLCYFFIRAARNLQPINEGRIRRPTYLSPINHKISHSKIKTYKLLLNAYLKYK